MALVALVFKSDRRSGMCVSFWTSALNRLPTPSCVEEDQYVSWWKWLVGVCQVKYSEGDIWKSGHDSGRASQPGHMSQQFLQG